MAVDDDFKKLYEISKRWNILYLFQAISILFSVNSLTYYSFNESQDINGFLIDFIIINIPLLSITSVVLYLVSSLNLIQNLFLLFVFRHYQDGLKEGFKNVFKNDYLTGKESVLKKHGYKNGDYMKKDRILMETWLLFLVLAPFSIPKIPSMMIVSILWVIEIILALGFVWKGILLGNELMTMQLLFIVEMMKINAFYPQFTKDNKTEPALHILFSKGTEIPEIKNDIVMGAWNVAFFKTKGLFENMLYIIDTEKRSIEEQIPDTIKRYFNETDFLEGRGGISQENLITMIEKKDFVRIFQNISKLAMFIYQLDSRLEKDFLRELNRLIGNFLTTLQWFIIPGGQNRFQTATINPDGKVKDFKEVFWTLMDDEISKRKNA